MADKETVVLTSERFQSEVLESQSPVLVDFWAPWCAPCRAIAPTVEALASEYAGQVKVAKLNVDEAQDLAREYDVRSIPTIAIFRGGRLLGKVVGVVPKAKLEALIEGALGDRAPLPAAG